MFEKHLEEPHGQVARIDEVVESCGIELKRIKCVAMEGLVVEGGEQIKEIEKGPVLDLALIGAAQKVEHYEIATYGTLAALTEKPSESAAQKLFLATLKEEKAADEKLTALAQGSIVEEAMTR